MSLKIKKLLSIIVSISMLISMLICPVYADAKSTLTLTGGNLSKDGTITVPVILNGVDSGITSFSFHLKYDEENLKFTKADVRSGFIPASNPAENLVSGMISSPDKCTDPVCTLYFTTNDNVLNGKYTISVEKGENDDAMFACNDDIISDSSITITPATIIVTGGTDKLTNDNTEISGVNDSYEYTGSEITPVPTVKYNGKTLKSGTDYTVKYENNKNVGTAKLIVTGYGEYIGSAEKEFKITKKSAEIKVSSSSYTKTYGDASFNIDASVNSGAELSYVSNDSNVVSVDGSGTVTVKKAGKAKITVSAPATDNYQKPSDKVINVTVAKAVQTITGADNFEKTYGDAAFNINAGIDPATGAKLSYVSSDEKVVSISNDGEVTIKGAGRAQITVTASEITDKYNKADKNISVTINRKELTVKGITAASKDYDGKTSAELVYPDSIDGVKTGDKVTVTAKGEFSDANAGNGKTVNITNIELSGESAPNYELAKTGNQATASADIKKVDYKGTVSAQTTVPANKAMSRRNFNISAFNLPAGFVNAKIESTSVLETDKLIDGEVKVSADGLSLEYNTTSVQSDETAKINVVISSTNYNNITAFIIITAKDVTINWDNYFKAKDSVVYGTTNAGIFTKSSSAGTAADAEGHSLTGRFSIIESDKIPSAADKHAVNVNFTVTAKGDYEDVVLSNTYYIAVTKKEIGLSWKNYNNLKYDGTEKNVTAAATGLVGNDSVKITVSGGTEKNAGKYTAAASGITGDAAGNYKLPALVTKEYTIAPADYSVTLSSDTVSVKVGTSDLSFLPTASAEGVKNEKPKGTLKFYSDRARNTELTSDYVKSLSVNENKGYKLYWSFITSDTNYNDTAKTGDITLKVTEGDPQYIAISGLEGKTYGDAPFTASASVTTTGGAEAAGHGQITWSSSNTNVAEIDASTGQITIKSAGETNITAKAEKVSGKYAEGSAAAALSIAKKTLTVDSITAANKEYDGTKAAKLKVAVSGILSGDTVTASAEGEFADAAVGTDKAVTVKSAKLEGDSASNYKMPEKYPEIKANITKISADKVKAEFTDLNQKTGSIKAPSVKLEPADDSAVVTVYIKKQIIKDETEATTGAEGSEKEEIAEWEWVEWTAETAPSEAGTYQVKAIVTSDNFDGTVEVKESTLTITKPSSGGGGGGGGAAVSSSKVNVNTAVNGKVSVTPESAEKGKTVTITATPDNGYEAVSVKVKDAKGNEIAVTKNSDGTYSFTMPDSSVTVSAEFAAKGSVSDIVCSEMSDIDNSMWYHESVHYALEKGIMNGYSSKKFGPNNTLSRAMLAQILYNHAGKPAAAAASYSDVNADDWFAAAVNWASANGVVTGFTDGTFRPNENITREQLAVMLYRYAGSPETKGSIAAFKDAASVSDYAATAMQWAVEKGIITGDGSADILNPQGNATRAQAAAMIMRYLENK